MSLRYAFISKMVALTLFSSSLSALAQHPHVTHAEHEALSEMDPLQLMKEITSRVSADPFSSLEIIVDQANKLYSTSLNGLSKYRLSVVYAPTLPIGTTFKSRVTSDPEGNVVLELTLHEAAKTNPFFLLDAIAHVSMFYDLNDLKAQDYKIFHLPKKHPHHQTQMGYHLETYAIAKTLGFPDELQNMHNPQNNESAMIALSPFETMEMISNARKGSPLAERRLRELEVKKFQLIKKAIANFKTIQNLDEKEKVKQLAALAAAYGIQLSSTDSYEIAIKEFQDKMDLAQKRQLDTLNAKAKEFYRQQVAQYKAGADVRESVVQGPSLSDMVKANDREGVARAMEVMLPWSLLEPSEKAFWQGFVEAIRKPNYDNAKIYFRGIDESEKAQLVLNEEKKVTGIGLFSKRLTAGSGSHLFKLKGLPETFETFGSSGMVNRVSPLTNPHLLTRMMMNHAGNPVGSPFLSLTSSLLTARGFSSGKHLRPKEGEDLEKLKAQYLAGNQSGGILTIRMDPRRVIVNTVSPLEGELEVLAAMFVFPDEVVHFEKGTSFIIWPAESKDYSKVVRVEVDTAAYYGRAREAVRVKTGIIMPPTFEEYAKQGQAEFKAGIFSLGKLFNLSSSTSAKACSQIFGK